MNWLNTTNGSLRVVKQYYHHHAQQIVAGNSKLSQLFLSALNKDIKIKPILRKKKWPEGLEANLLNSEIRNLLSNGLKEQLVFEVQEAQGVFYYGEDVGSIGGFDFGIINHRKNLLALRNLCFGTLIYQDAVERWDKFLKKNPELAKFPEASIKKNEIGVDLTYTSAEGDPPLFLGEIQFGNWGLAYRDLFKVLKANVQNSIDCLIYIVATDSLEKRLSDGIVTFDKMKKVIQDFEKVISVPIWLIAIDLST